MNDSSAWGCMIQENPLEDHPGGDLAAFCSRLLTVISATAVESETLRTSTSGQNSKNTSRGWKTPRLEIRR